MELATTQPQAVSVKSAAVHVLPAQLHLPTAPAALHYLFYSMDNVSNPAILAFIDRTTPVFLATVPAITVLTNLTAFPAHSVSTSLPPTPVSQFVL